MFYEGNISGKFVSLRSAEVKDAEVTLKLRLNPEKTKFLRKLEYNVEKQKQWIRKQRDLYGDYFFVVEDRLSSKVIGTMGISEILFDRGHIGRLLMYGNALQSYEAYLLLSKFGFEQIKLEELYGDIDIKNKSAMKFSKMFGFQYGSPVYDPDLDRDVCWGRVFKEDFYSYVQKIEKLIYR